MSPSSPLLAAGPLFITDGGLETTLVFQHGIDLPDFAAFPLVDDEAGRATLTAYFSPYLDIAERLGLGFVLDTPTWRANLEWGARLGYDPVALAALNRRSVELVTAMAAQHPTLTTVINGVVGPRGDGYVVGSAMSPSEAEAYHALQAQAFADAGAAMVTAVTMTYADEAIGVTRAARTVDLPVVISFTVETDGCLPSGQPLDAAINQVDDESDGGPLHYMINCAHPSHFASVIDPAAPWSQRIRAIRANASTASHAELDEAEELDRGNPAQLALDYLELQAALPGLRVVGGCCGTDHEHVGAIATALSR
jgi:S-methylmethionine-dependent homocysteine/selenocysteine methylase